MEIWIIVAILFLLLAWFSNSRICLFFAALFGLFFAITQILSSIPH